MLSSLKILMMYFLFKHFFNFIFDLSIVSSFIEMIRLPNQSCALKRWCVYFFRNRSRVKGHLKLYLAFLQDEPHRCDDDDDDAGDENSQPEHEPGWEMVDGEMRQLAYVKCISFIIWNISFHSKIVQLAAWLCS